MLSMSGYIPTYSGTAFNTVEGSSAPLPYTGWVPFTAAGYQSGDLGVIKTTASTVYLTSYTSINLLVTASTGVPNDWLVDGLFVPNGNVSSLRISSTVTTNRSSQVPSEYTAAPNPLMMPTLWVLSDNITNDTHWYHRWGGSTAWEEFIGSTASGISYQYGSYTTSYPNPKSALSLTIEAHPTSGTPKTTAIFDIRSIEWTASGYCTGLIYP